MSNFFSLCVLVLCLTARPPQVRGTLSQKQKSAAEGHNLEKTLVFFTCFAHFKLSIVKQQTLSLHFTYHRFPLAHCDII